MVDRVIRGTPKVAMQVATFFLYVNNFFLRYLKFYDTYIHHHESLDLKSRVVTT